MAVGAAPMLRQYQLPADASASVSAPGVCSSVTSAARPDGYPPKKYGSEVR
jgi:hypothetical protein